MARHKWGESFLKSGLPLEHLTLVVLKDQGFFCYPSVEYQRPDESREGVWFEIDLEAISGSKNKETSLSLLVECKYHDESRFWFFLPCENDRWGFNDRVFNCGPLQTLTRPLSRTALQLAPLSYRGLVVCKDGTKQDNAVHTAVQQLANAFTPISLRIMFRYRLDAPKGQLPMSTAMIPMIVTNAAIFRLKSNVTDLSVIKQAGAPADIGDEVPWLWCHYDPSRDLFIRNARAVGDYLKQEPELVERFPIVENRLELWPSRPNWIAVVNVQHLAPTLRTLQEHFLSLKTCRSRTALDTKRKVRIK